MKFVIDRFEGDTAVLVNDITLNVPRSILPKDAKEGDVIIVEIKVDREETERLRKEVEGRLKYLKDREEKGDIWL